MAFAFVSGTNVSTDNGTAPTTAAVNTTGVDLLIISCGYYNPAQDGTLPAVSDSKGNTWTALTVRNTGVNAANVILYAKNPTVGSGHTFTISTNYSSICVAGFSGADTTAPFDVQNGAGSSSSASISTGSITPSAANELIIDGGAAGASGALTSMGSGFTTAQTNNGGSSSFPSALGYKIQTTATAENPTITFNFATQVGVSIASFKAAAAGGGSPYTLTATTGAVAVAGTTTGLNYIGPMALDPAYTHAFTTLSNSNLTATRTAGAGYSDSLSFPIDASTTKAYAELTLGTQTTATGWGIANTSAALNQGIGVDNNGIAVYGLNILINNTVPASLPGRQPAVGDVMAVAADKTAQTAAFRNVTAGAAWSTAMSVSAISGPWRFAISQNNSIGNYATVNFLGTFLGTPPSSGYTRWDGSAISGATYTLTATVGAVTLAGTTTGLSAAYLLTATSGAVTLAGTATGLAAAYLLTATPGALTLAGTTTGLLRGYVLGASPGAITLAGSDAGLVKIGSYSLTATTGAVTLTGNVANLVTAGSYILNAMPGAVVLAGTGTGVTATRFLTATLGSVTLAGTATGISAARVLVPTTGAITLAGTATGLAAARILAATTGAITLAGNAANLVKTGVGYVLTATSGAITLAGNAVNFLQGYVIGVAPGVVVVTRPNANLVYTHLNQYVLATQSAAIMVDGNRMEFAPRLFEKQPGPLNFGRKAYIPGRW